VLVSSTLRILVPKIGDSVLRCRLYRVILDENKDELAADGATGEIGIAGVGLALVTSTERSSRKQKFIPDFLNLPNNPSGASIAAAISAASLTAARIPRP